MGPLTDGDTVEVKAEVEVEAAAEVEAEAVLGDAFMSGMCVGSAEACFRRGMESHGSHCQLWAFQNHRCVGFATGVSAFAVVSVGGVDA